MSTTSPHPRPSGVCSESVRQIIDTFQSAFGTSFDCWRREGPGWVRLTQGTTIVDWAVLLDEVAATSQSQYLEALLAIPFVADHGMSFIAIGRLETEESQWAISLAQSLVREFQLRQQIDQLQQHVAACNVQISSDFEDLAFLRQIAEHLDMAGVSVPLSQFAETILQLLRRSVNAGALVFVGALQTAVEHTLVPALCVGEGVDSEDVYRRLVRRFGRPDLKPVIMNHVTLRDDSDEFPGIDTLMMVRVARDDELFGWLLAINRDKNLVANLDHIDAEFGTVEAGMVSITASVLATHARNVQLFREKENVLISLVRSLVNAIEAKDSYTCGHSERVAMFAKRLAQAAGLDADACERIYFSGLLHDVGKIGISDAVLMKPGKLTAEELAEIQTHPDLGWQILQDSQQLAPIFPGVVHHHERADGAGYPDGLAGEGIPLDARILAVADAYDAMTSDRAYRQGLSQERVEAILREEAGSQWDADIIAIFLQIMPAIVELRQNYQRPTKPKRKHHSATTNK